jgi:hypothetical protein
MLKVNKYLKTGLALSAIVAMSTGLSTGPVYAQEEEDEKEKDAIREVLVDCDQGQSVQKILRKFANDTKPLEITVRGTCDLTKKFRSNVTMLISVAMMKWAQLSRLC